jgi:hypothetical protein
MKLLSSEEATTILLPKLSSARGRLTVADAAAATGMAIEDARTALDALMNRYACRLQISESGEILYDFGRSLHRRGEKSFGEVAAEVWAVLWKAITFLFKIWISVTLVVYFAVFVVILIAILIALSGKDGDSPFDFIGDIFGDIFSGIGHGMILVNATDRQGYQHKAYAQTKRKEPAKTETKKRFVQSVYDFVLGPPRPAFDPFSNEKEVLAWLRQSRGVLTTTEVAALAGWTFEQAEERFTEYLTRFKGEAEITEEGVLIGTFRQVLSSGDASMEGGKVELFWDEYEAPYKVTGNSVGRNVFIACMNFFNLIWAFAFAALEPTDTDSVFFQVLPDWVSIGSVNIVLGWIPLLYSLAVFILPFIRIFTVAKLESGRVERNRRRRIIRAVFEQAGQDFSAASLSGIVNAGPQTPLPEKVFSRLLDRIAVEYQGRTTLNEEGTTLYRFDRITREREAADRFRAASPGPDATDRIIFDTGSGALPSPA